MSGRPDPWGSPVGSRAGDSPFQGTLRLDNRPDFRRIAAVYVDISTSLPLGYSLNEEAPELSLAAGH